MESTSTPASRGTVSWKGLLFTASLLSLWTPPITAQIMVESVPPNAAEGNRVLLRIHNLPQNSARCNWYKNEIKEDNRIISWIAKPEIKVLGPLYSGRETIYSNESLLILNLNLEDTGTYVILIVTENFDIFQGSGQFRVHPGRGATNNPTGTFPGIAIGFQVGVLLAAAIGYLLFCRRSERNPGQHDHRGQLTPICYPGPGTPSSSAIQVPLPDLSPAVPVYEELLFQDSSLYCQMNPKADVAP